MYFKWLKEYFKIGNDKARCTTLFFPNQINKTKMLASSFRDLRVHCGTRTCVSSQWTSTALTLRLLPITQIFDFSSVPHLHAQNPEKT